MKILLLLQLVLMSSLKVDGLYICVSKIAFKYHLSKNCKGLSRCIHTISKVALPDPKKKCYTLCGWED
jgi:hypothetical protein